MHTHTDHWNLCDVAEALPDDDTMECCERCDGGVDRLSELPNEIILVILSFLSLGECVTTSVLSSRWSDLWKHIPNLNLDAKLLTNDYHSLIRGSKWDAERCKYIEIVNSVLQSHKSPSLKEFRISLYANESAQCAVAKWLEFGISRQVEKLELDLQCQDSKVCLPQNLIGFKSLKSLCLKYFKVSGQAIDSLLRNCPLLEELYIHSSILTSDIVVCGTALALKHFDINVCYGLPVGENTIKISAPNLTWLRLCTTHKLVPKHFASTDRLQFLSLDLFFPEVFFAVGFPQMPMLKKLTVIYSGDYEHGLLPVTALIRASPLLQEFKLHVVGSLTFHSTSQNGESHLHRHLKAFEFLGFSVGAGDHIELLKYILDNCIALEKITLWRLSLSRAEPRLARDRLEQLLDGKVPHHIQLYIV
ncbi:putative F-box/FBD/LRR-repeat protein At4g13965 [Salvia miltiorrhiza]|uniref:putative F-box/FBD/LRR-repeat protein At4g13965 n=1 Tax=Salvia miltiorrhiza TaxID=226208 RepID=UPI0025AB7149|nr:putative F-box/FBD/LRR-repeat protein At4g13965 [Salvia miltiorrhiza]